MKYQDILPDVLTGKWVRHKFNHPWYRMDYSGVFLKKGEIGERTIPLERNDYLLDTWEVKPDEPEEIYVWGMSRPLSDNEYETFISIDPYFPNENLTRIVSENPLFPIGKPQKYKLIPVDEEPDSFEEWNKKQGEISEYAKTIGDNRWTNTEISRHMQIAAVIYQERKKAWETAFNAGNKGMHEAFKVGIEQISSASDKDTIIGKLVSLIADLRRNQ